MNHLFLEITKYNKKNLVLIVSGFTLLPFVSTVAFIYFKSSEISSIPLSMIEENSTGAWSSLLYPVFVILVAQLLVGAEKKSNALHYYKAYRSNWFMVIGLKVLIAILALLNTTSSILSILYANQYIQSIDVTNLITATSIKHVWLFLSMLPLVFFHLMLYFSIKNSYLSFALGIILLTIGIPVVNLSTFYFNPYSYGIAVLSPRYGIFKLVGMGFGIATFSIILVNFFLVKSSSQR